MAALATHEVPSLRIRWRREQDVAFTGEAVTVSCYPRLGHHPRNLRLARVIHGKMLAQRPLDPTVIGPRERLRVIPRAIFTPKNPRESTFSAAGGREAPHRLSPTPHC